MDNIRGLPVYRLVGNGNLLVHQVASVLSMRDLTGALSACRAFRAMIPDGVRTLDTGSHPRDRWDFADELVLALVQLVPSC